MDSTNFSRRPRKDKLAAIPDAGNKAEMNPSVILKNLKYENTEEMKENVSTTLPSKVRRSLRIPHKSLRLNGDSESGSRPRRHIAKKNYFPSSSDDEEGKSRKTGDHGRSGRKSVGKPVYKECSSVEEDSTLESEEPETKSTSKVEENETASNHESPQKSPKRKKDESDRDSPNVAKRRSTRFPSSDDETTDLHDDIPQETSRQKPTRKSSKRIESGIPLSAGNGDNRDLQDDAAEFDTMQVTTTPRTAKLRRRCGVGDDAAECDTTQVTTTPKTAKLGRRRGIQDDAAECDTTQVTTTPKTAKLGRRRGIQDDAAECDTTQVTTTPKSAKLGRRCKPRKSELYQMRVKETSEEEGSDMVTGRPLRSTVMAARRSSRIKSVDDDSDCLPRDSSERLPKSNQTPRSRRNKTPSARNKEDCAEELHEAEDESTTKKTPKRRGKTPKKKSPAKTPRNLRPSMPERTSSIADTGSTLDGIRSNLHVSTVPKSLPCREKEFENIYCFVGAKIFDSAGGCMYISGMPGTGKTATVHAVVRRLEDDVADGRLPPFQFIEVNGLRLTEPRQVFVRILQELTGEKCTPQHAQEILAKKFTSARGFNKAVLLLVDEVDMLRNRRQDVMYNLFDWPSKAHSKLIVLTIANTMDLPERLLMGRVTSRLGLTRLTFEPYQYKQLQEIVTARLQGSDCFNPDAVQLVARKVAAVSGDARRALDICRRATELLTSDDEHVSMPVINTALSQMMNSASIKTLKACSRMEKLFLQAVVAETTRTGVEETNFNSVYRQFKEICNFDGIRVPNVSQSLSIVNRLGSSRILLTEHGKADIMQTIYLNVNNDDIHYAMTKPVAA